MNNPKRNKLIISISVIIFMIIFLSIALVLWNNYQTEKISKYNLAKHMIEYKQEYCENRLYPINRCLAIQNNDITFCSFKENSIVQSINNQSNRYEDPSKECISVSKSILAIYHNNISMCLAIEDNNLKNYCIATITKDVNYCSNLKGKLDYYGTETIDEKLFCRLIFLENNTQEYPPELSIWINNYRAFINGLRTKDGKYCEEIIPLNNLGPIGTQGKVKSSDKMKGDCLGLLTNSTDVNFCQSYHDQTCKDNFLYSVSRLQSNKTICSQIEDTKKRELCLLDTTT